MSSTPEPAVLQCAMRLRNDPAMRPFLEYLARRREKHRDVCESASGETALRAAGRSQELKELLDLVERSRDLLDKCNPAPQGRLSQP